MDVERLLIYNGPARGRRTTEGQRHCQSWHGPIHSYWLDAVIVDAPNLRVR
jgi:hypothetical protein